MLINFQFGNMAAIKCPRRKLRKKEEEGTGV
jgi:hypothetical protein